MLKQFPCHCVHSNLSASKLCNSDYLNNNMKQFYRNINGRPNEKDEIKIY